MRHPDKLPRYTVSQTTSLPKIKPVDLVGNCPVGYFRVETLWVEFVPGELPENYLHNISSTYLDKKGQIFCPSSRIENPAIDDLLVSIFMINVFTRRLLRFFHLSVIQ